MPSLPFRIRHKRYEFKLKAGFTVICLLVVTLCCFLGNWQLYRYHFKQKLLQTYQQNTLHAPVPFLRAVAKNSDLQFLPVSVAGVYDNELTVLLQNRPYKNQMGFEVITPLKLAGEKKLLLVDRGWVAAGKNQSLPMINAVSARQQITGTIKLLNERQFILGKNILVTNALPLIMQKMDVEELSRITQREFYPFILRLSPQSGNGFVRDWTISTVMPERHLGYAVQWFGMALALVIAYLCFCCERVKNAKK